MTSPTKLSYVGTELELFAKATNWKTYACEKLQPYIAGSVIEVGAGIGGSTKYLTNRSHVRWLCLDPDSDHVSHIRGLISAGKLPPYCEARWGVLTDLSLDECADTIIYFDVLEHIEDDEEEMRAAAARLTSGGHLIVLSPAFNFLYSPFDAAIGHLRRYAPKDAMRLKVRTLSLQRVFFLDCVGFFASAFNRLVMQTSKPSDRQIQIWDKMMVPASSLIDKIFNQMFGRSIVMIWQKT